MALASPSYRRNCESLLELATLGKVREMEMREKQNIHARTFLGGLGQLQNS